MDAWAGWRQWVGVHTSGSARQDVGVDVVAKDVAGDVGGVKIWEEMQQMPSTFKPGLTVALVGEECMVAFGVLLAGAVIVNKQPLQPGPYLMQVLLAPNMEYSS